MILENFTNFLDLCIKEASSIQRYAHSDLQHQEASAAEETFFPINVISKINKNVENNKFNQDFFIFHDIFRNGKRIPFHKQAPY